MLVMCWWCHWCHHFRRHRCCVVGCDDGDGSVIVNMLDSTRSLPSPPDARFLCFVLDKDSL